MLIGEITRSLNGYRAVLRDNNTEQIVWRYPKHQRTEQAALKMLEIRIKQAQEKGVMIEFNPRTQSEKVLTPRTAKDYDNACYRLTPEEYYQRLAQEKGGVNDLQPI